MKEIRLVLLGFGSANCALAQMLLDKSEKDDSSRRQCLRISTSCSSFTYELVPWKVVGIITRRHGSICVPFSSTSEGINVKDALDRIRTGGMLDATLMRDATDAHSAAAATTTEETIKLLKELGKTQTANIVVEAIPSNPKSNGEPAISFIRTALQAGMHVASANKCPLAHKQNDKETYFELQEIANSNKKLYLHESAVMDGVPVFSLWNNTLQNVTCTKIRGLLNSTTTMILSRIEGNINEAVDSDGQVKHVGETFEEAMEAAKRMGIVEEDESLDIDGWDAAMKLRALCVFLSSSSKLLSSEVHDVSIPPLEAIVRDSIRHIDPELICTAFRTSRRKVRSVATAELIDLASDPAVGRNHPVKTWKMSVKNEFLSQSDPLYNLSGTSSSVQFETDTMGPISLVSDDPTLMDTAYGLFADIVRIATSG